jgi:hypothetical protein
VIGGLGTSTFLTLICVPVLYSYATRKNTTIHKVNTHWTGSLGQTDEQPAQT